MKLKNIQSKKLFLEAQSLMPGGVNSPVRSFKSVGGTPHFILKGKDAFIFDEDGNKFLDFTCSWGPLILGHSNKKIELSIIKALKNGTSFGTPTKKENILAKLIIDLVPSIEKIRFVNSGTEATMSAIRLARAYTERDLIIKFEGCYHGHCDFFLSNAGSGLATLDKPSSPGIPKSVVESTITLSFNDLNSVKEIFKRYPDKIAAIILEPITGNMGVIKPIKDFVEGLRVLADKYSSILIFDEVMTGFRVSLGGAQEILKIKPDLTTLGKIIGGGLPVGAYGGKKEIMQKIAPEGSVYQAGTLSGNPISMAAGIASLEQLKNRDLYDYLNQLAKYFAKSLLDIANKNKIPLIVNQSGSMIGIFFSDKNIRNFKDVKKSNILRFNDLHLFLLQNKIYFPPSAYEALFISTKHTKKDIDTVLCTINKFFKTI